MTLAVGLYTISGWYVPDCMRNNAFVAIVHGCVAGWEKETRGVQTERKEKCNRQTQARPIVEVVDVRLRMPVIEIEKGQPPRAKRRTVTRGDPAS